MMNLSAKNTKKWTLVALVLALAAGFLFQSESTVVGSVQGDAASLYKSKCASCHGADGSGNTAYGKKNNLRDLRSPEVQKQTDDQLYAIIVKGKGKMPGYEKSLGADKCKALVSYTRTLKR